MNNEIGYLIQQRDFYMLNENDDQAERIQAIIDAKLKERVETSKAKRENNKTSIGRRM